VIETQCLCGGVRITIDAEPFAQFYCHCRDCQRAHAAAYVGEALYPAQSVRVEGAAIAYAVRDVQRLACARCGARLLAELPNIGMRGVSAALLPPGAFRPTLHINCESAVAPVADALAHYARMPQEHGGDGVRVDW
jgi:hypothetical protein